MKRFIPILLAFVCSLACAQTPVTAISGRVFDQYGSPLSLAQIRVCAATSTGIPCTPTVPIYRDYGLTQQIPNPTAADQYGNYTFYVPQLTAPNLYTVQESANGGLTWSYVYNGPSNQSGGSPPSPPAYTVQLANFPSGTEFLSYSDVAVGAVGHNIIARNISYHTPKDYGAAANGTYVHDAVMGANSCVVTSASGGFAGAQAGMIMFVVGAGNPAWDGPAPSFAQTIASVQSNSQVTMNRDSSGNCAYQSVTAPTNGNWDAMFGTDDSAGLQACITNGPLVGGICTIPQGQTLTYANAALFLSNTQAQTPGGKVNGTGTLVFIPIAPLSFPTTMLGMWIDATQRTSCEQITSSGIPIGSTSFTVASSSEYAGMQPGDWMVLQMEPIAGVVEQMDWVQFLSGSGTTVNLMRPTRMAFTSPVAYSSSCQGLAFFGLAQNSVPTSINLSDFTMIVPNVQGNGQHATAIDAQFSRSLTMDTLTVQNAGERNFAANFDQNDIAINDHFNESYRSEYTNSVDDVLTNDSWDNTPSSITGGQSYGFVASPSGGSDSAGPSFSYGAGFYTVRGLKIHNPRSTAAIAAYSGFHDSDVSDIDIDYSTSTANPTAGILVTGGYNNHFSKLTFSGAAATVGSTGLLIQNDLENGICFPATNNQWEKIDAPAYLAAVSTVNCLGSTITSVGTSIDQNTGQLLFSSGIEALGASSFGSDTTPVLNPLIIYGSPTGGMQIPFVGGTISNTFGAIYSFGSPFTAYNAGQLTYGVDQWMQNYPAVGSTLLAHDDTNGLNFSTAPSASGNNPFALFWARQFAVDVTGHVSGSGFYLFPAGVGNGAGNHVQIIAPSLTANHSLTIPDASTVPVQPLTSAPSGGCVGWIDSSGVQHGASCPAGISIRAGSWTISSATSIAITFATAMASTPNSCSVTPTASTASTGQPYFTSPSSTGITINIPTSGSLSGTYSCEFNNTN